MIKKVMEQRCLAVVRKLKHYPELDGNYDDSERPDFVFGTVGLEHFLTDELQYKKKKDLHSVTRTHLNSIVNRVQYYKENPEKLDEDIANDSAVQYIENITNEQIYAMSKFKYQEFADNFERVYKQHYDNLFEYRKKCKQVGFLIEIPYIKPLGCHGYIITNNGKKYNQCVKTIPFTRDMIRCLKWNNNADFVIFCMMPVDFHSSSEDYKNCQVIRVDMMNVDKSIRQQGIIICDEFDFPVKFDNKDVVKLNAEHNKRNGD